LTSAKKVDAVGSVVAVAVLLVFVVVEAEELLFFMVW
jgi:hypothetical protein